MILNIDVIFKPSCFPFFLAVFHRLVDHHRCCCEIPSGGRLQPFLPRLWGHSHHRIPDVRTPHRNLCSGENAGVGNAEV